MIQLKPKKCKGQNKAISFPGCGKTVLNRKFGLCMNCYPEFILNTEPGKLIMQKAMLKGKAVVKSISVKETKEKKDKLKNWANGLQKKINEIVRLIDKGLPCLATGIHANQIHAGHIYARGGNQTIRFNLHNIHRQSAQSNHFQNDDGKLREGLVNEYGSHYMEFVSNLRHTPQLKYSNGDYHEFYKKASGIALKLKKEDLNYELKDRIWKRDEINNELKIYDYEFCTFNSIPF